MLVVLSDLLARTLAQGCSRSGQQGTDTGLPPQQPEGVSRGQRAEKKRRRGAKGPGGEGGEGEGGEQSAEVGGAGVGCPPADATMHGLAALLAAARVRSRVRDLGA